jgi:hypothetical protein
VSPEQGFEVIAEPNPETEDGLTGSTLELADLFLGFFPGVRGRVQKNAAVSWQKNIRLTRCSRLHLESLFIIPAVLDPST